MQVKYKLADTKATETFGQELAKYIQPPLMVGLRGEIGMGKTCLTRALIQAMGVSSKVKSPSFNLLETYQIRDVEIIHFDLYRLNSVYELEELGFRDYLHSKSICFIEWPERAPMLQVLIDLMLEFSFTPESDGRNLLLNSHTPLGERVLENLQRDSCLK